MNHLQRHHSVGTSSSSAKVEYKVEGDFLEVNFLVSPSEQNLSENFNKDRWDNHRLWDFDVMEVFVRKGTSGPYLELQVSPLGQKFALRISKPRVEVNAVKSFKFTSASGSIVNNEYQALFRVHASDIPGVGHEIYGNLFCCLGSAENREYFALNPNSEAIPDFHLPDYFAKLGEL